MSSNQRPKGGHFRILVNKRRHEVRGVPFSVKWGHHVVRATRLACLVVLVALATPCDDAAGQFPLPPLRDPFRWRGTLVADSGLPGSVKARAGRLATHDEPGLLGRFRCKGPGCPGHRGQFYVIPPSTYPPAGGKIYGTMDFGRAPRRSDTLSGHHHTGCVFYGPASSDDSFRLPYTCYADCPQCPSNPITSTGVLDLTRQH